MWTKLNGLFIGSFGFFFRPNINEPLTLAQHLDTDGSDPVPEILCPDQSVDKTPQTRVKRLIPPHVQHWISRFVNPG